VGRSDSVNDHRLKATHNWDVITEPDGCIVELETADVSKNHVACIFHITHSTMQSCRYERFGGSCCIHREGKFRIMSVTTYTTVASQPWRPEI
jgi:hypothetical protein